MHLRRILTAAAGVALATALAATPAVAVVPQAAGVDVSARAQVSLHYAMPGQVKVGQDLGYKMDGADGRSHPETVCLWAHAAGKGWRPVHCGATSTTGYAFLKSDIWIHHVGRFEFRAELDQVLGKGAGTHYRPILASRPFWVTVTK